VKVVVRKSAYCKCPYCDKYCGSGESSCKHYRGIKYDLHKKSIKHLFEK
jgi:predicted nucleic acid-binding Zn finger protein